MNTFGNKFKKVVSANRDAISNDIRTFTDTGRFKFGKQQGGGKSENSSVASSSPQEPVKLTLSSNVPYHTGGITAKGNVPITPGKFVYYRSDDGGRFETIAETLKPNYTPSLDDVGCRICCQWKSSDGDVASTFAEFGPLIMDPRVENQAEDMLALARGKHARFVSFKKDKQAVVLYVSSSKVWVKHAGTDAQLAIFSAVEGIMIELHPTSGVADIMDHTGASRFAVSCQDGVSRDVLALTIRRLFTAPGSSTNAQDGGGQQASDDECDLLDFLDDVTEDGDVSVKALTVEPIESTDSLVETGPMVNVSITLSGLANAEADSEASAGTIAELRAQLSLVERDLSRTKNEFTALQDTYRLERLAIDEVSKLRVQLEEACSDRDSGKSEMGAVQLTLANLSQQLVDKAVAASNSDEIVQTLTSEKEELLNRMNMLVDQGNSASLEMESNLQGELDRLMEEVGVQAEELVRKKAELADLADCRESEEKAKELQGVAEEYARTMEGKLKKEKGKKRKLADEIATLRSEGALTVQETLESLRTLLGVSEKQRTEQDEAIGQLRSRTEAMGAELARETARGTAAEEAELAAKKDMLEQVSEQRTELETMITERNFFKRKASSLVASVESLRKELDVAAKTKVAPRGARNKELDTLEAKLAKVTAERAESSAMAGAYKEAFEQQLKQKSKEEKRLKKVDKAKGVKPGVSGIASLQSLTTSLSEMLVDKELIITNAKQSNELLNQRIGDLEAELSSKSGCSCNRPPTADESDSKKDFTTYTNAS
jgi:hypothetical protein